MQQNHETRQLLLPWEVPKVPIGRPRLTDDDKARKAADKARKAIIDNASTCETFRAQVIQLLADHDLEILDMLSILLLKFPGETEDQAVEGRKNRYVSRWLKGDCALNWPQKEESTQWELVLDTLMNHPKNKEGYSTEIYHVRLALPYMNVS